MKRLSCTLAVIGTLALAAPALAQNGSAGEPFGTEVVKPSAPVKDDLDNDNLTPGGVDDAIQGALADNDGQIRGHGREAAPGHNK